MDVLVDPGGFAEFLRVPARIVKHGLFSLPDTLSMPEATLAEPLACCLHGLDALAVSPLDHLLIIGDGPMGLLQAEAARVFGVKQIILVGKIPERLERARKIADIVVDARDGDITEAIYRAAPGGANKILVSVGNGEVAKDALRYVHKGGAVNLFAGLAKGTSLCIDPAQIHYDEVRLIGSFGFAPSHFQKAIQWLAERKINTEGIITATVSLSEAKAAFQDVSAYHGIKTIVTFSEKDEDINPN
jgi:L-iditol 2-dehydrogenase